MTPTNPNKEDRMPITHLIVDHYMRVQHVDLKPRPGLNEVTGLNGAGKSSLLNALSTMGGKKQVAWKPIHDGAEEARIIIEMDGVGEVPVRMVRTFKLNEAGEIVQTVVLEGPGGARFPKPQALLDAIVGEFSFDPLSVLSMDKGRLQSVLEKFVTDFDFAADRAAYDADFDARTDVNRRLKDTKSQVAGISVPSGTPAEPIDESALVAELQQVGEHNADIERRKGNRQRVADEAIRFRAEADSFDTQAADYRRLADEAEAKGKELRAKAEDNDKRLADAGPLPDPKDASEITAQIERARVVNAAVADLKRRNQLIGAVERLQAESDDLTKKLDERRAARAEAVKSAKMPVDGLMFDDDGTVLFNGQPLEQASQAEKIRVSVAIAAALSPKLKVAIVKDGSLLDRNSWALLEKYADENGLQVFCETVDSSRPTAIVIEDGRIQATDAATEPMDKVA